MVLKLGAQTFCLQERAQHASQSGLSLVNSADQSFRASRSLRTGCPRSQGLINYPGVAAIDQLFQTARTALGDRGVYLVDHQIFVGSAFDGAEDADRLRKVWLFHARQHE